MAGPDARQWLNDESGNRGKKDASFNHIVVLVFVDPPLYGNAYT